MKHKNRVWYIESLNNPTNRWVFENLSIDRDAGILIDAPVEIEEVGQRTIVQKNLVQVTKEDIAALREHEKEFRLLFKVYMRESHGAKIQPWLMKLAA